MAIDSQGEAASLDFKRALPPKQKIRDLAKDAASMAIEGGVILIGVDEEAGVASAIVPLALTGATERVQQVIDANISPPLAVEIFQLREKPGDEEGVLVIEIPASWSAPHQYEGRYPARAGATTRYLTEREVEGLYARRWDLRQEASAAVGLHGHRTPPGVRIDFSGQPIGLMRLHIRPPTRVSAPAEPHLGSVLADAVQAASSSLAPLVDASLSPHSLDLLRSWTPAGTEGWRSGTFVHGESPISAGVGAMYAYGGGFSFVVAINLGEVEPGAPPGSLCSFEHLWAVETMALCSVAGHFFAPLTEASLLYVDLELGGLLDSVSWQASRGLAFGSNAPRVTENLYVRGAVFSSRELADDPRDATRALLDPFMVSILTEGSDVVGWVQSGQY